MDEQRLGVGGALVALGEHGQEAVLGDLVERDQLAFLVDHPLAPPPRGHLEGVAGGRAERQHRQQQGQPEGPAGPDEQLEQHRAPADGPGRPPRPGRPRTPGGRPGRWSARGAPRPPRGRRAGGWPRCRGRPRARRGRPRTGPPRSGSGRRRSRRRTARSRRRWPRPGRCRRAARPCAGRRSAPVFAGPCSVWRSTSTRSLPWSLSVMSSRSIPRRSQPRPAIQRAATTSTPSPITQATNPSGTGPLPPMGAPPRL